MGEYDEYFQKGEAFTLRDMNKVAPRTQTVDTLVSEIVGKTIYTTNPILIKKLAEWKKAKGDSEEPDNWMEDEAKIAELKAIL